jgi:hypothetical protein
MLQFHILPNTLSKHFSLWPNIPQQFEVSVCRSSNDSRFVHVQFVSHSFRLAMVAPLSSHWGTAWIHSHIFHGSVPLIITQLLIFMPKPKHFFGAYYLKITLPLQSTTISYVKCSVGL